MGTESEIRLERRRAWLPFFAALALACRTVSEVSPPPEPVTLNTSLPPIEIRYGLAVEDIELAILLAIASPSKPPVLEPGEPITDDLLPAIIGRARRARGAERPWYFAGRRPGLVFAGYDRGAVAMRVAIRYDEEIILLRIVDSRNLGQTGDYIRVGAFALLRKLDDRIRRSVLAVAQRNRYGTPLPVNR